MNSTFLINGPYQQFQVLAGACWLLGFGFALMPFDAYEAESFLFSAVFTGFAFIAAVVGAPLSGLRTLARSPVFWGVAAFWALAFVSVLASEVSAVSFIYFVFFSALPLSFILFSAYGADSLLLKVCLGGVALILASLAAFAVVSYYALPAFLFYGQVHWPLANPNSFAGLMAFGFWGAFGGLLYVNEKRWLVVSGFFAVLFFATILMTGSVGALLALVLVLPLFLVVLRERVADKKGFVGAVVLLCAGLSTVYSMPLDQMRNASVETTVAGQEMLSSRPAIWQSTMEIFQSHPWTGTGIGTFFLYYPEVRSPEDVSTAGLMAHSDPLQFTAEMGVLAPIIFYVLGVLILIKTYKAMVNKDSVRKRKVVVFTAFCALMSMLLHTHVTFHFNILSMLMLTGMVLAWLDSMTCTCRKDVLVEGVLYNRSVLRFTFLLPFIIILAVYSQLQSGHILINSAQRNLNLGDIDTAIVQINKAEQIGMGTNARAYLAAADIHLGILQLNAPLMPKDDLAAMVRDVRGLIDKSEQYNPRSAEVLYARGELRAYTEPFLREGDRTEGKRAYALFEDALMLDPLHLPSRVKLIDAAIRSKDMDKALVLLEEGLQWRYRTQNPRFFLEKAGRIAKDAGREDVYERAKQEWAFYFSEAYTVEDAP